MPRSEQLRREEEISSSIISPRAGFPTLRLRRLRRTHKIRQLISETRLSPSDLVYPLFIDENISRPAPITSMPGQLRQPVDEMGAIAELLVTTGINGVMLFGIPRRKDEMGSAASDDDGVIQRSIGLIKDSVAEDLVVMCDVCLCEYTTHGHCGIVKDGEVLNDPTIETLAKIATSYARAGADVVAPSAMMDGQVLALRQALDGAGYGNTMIMSYSAKHASSLYGPFRDAASSTPSFGDRRGYQMDYRNSEEAMREIALDIQEGADIVMVKPALAYLDIVREAKRIFRMPMAAYNVSGEYAMVKAASERGWISERDVVIEVLTSIKRAGADFILTYHAIDAASWLRNK